MKDSVHGWFQMRWGVLRIWDNIYCTKPREKWFRNRWSDWDRINLIPFCVPHRIENTNHFSGWLNSFSPPDSLGLNWFLPFFHSPFSFKLQFAGSDGLQKGKSPLESECVRTFPLGMAIKTGARNKELNEMSCVMDSTRSLSRTKALIMTSWQADGHYHTHKATIK